MKKKIVLEYPFKSTSPVALWIAITSPVKLSEWFADKVEASHEEYTFYFDKIPQSAKVIRMKEGSEIVYHWEDSDLDDFFGFKILISELTGEITLEVKDITEESDYDVSIKLWDAQIERLQRILGV